tara:strand:- start:189 stop:560 length:372 start_codon:yes stop_codon:yes gene_type:complete
MIDYLLKFPSREDAVSFGASLGYVEKNDDGDDVVTLADHGYSISVIGEHYSDGELVESPLGDKSPEGDDIEPVREKVGDGNHWILFRDKKGTIEVPPEATSLIIWTSADEEPRPESVPDRAFC